MVAPLFATEAANARIRLMLALVITFMVYPLMDWPRLDPLSSAGFIALLNQIAIGIVMGMSLQVIVAALVVAGTTRTWNPSWRRRRRMFRFMPKS